MQKEKTGDTINSAITHLENSMQILASNSDEKAVANSLWLASSEIEYTIFLFSLMHPEKSESYPWKHSSQPKQVVEVGPALASALNFLKKAKNSFKADATEKAYEEIWAVRVLLLKVQELFEKKRKSAAVQAPRTQ